MRQKMTLEEQREKWRLHQIEFRASHPDYDREYYQRNREKLKERAKQYYRSKKMKEAEKKAAFMKHLKAKIA